MGLKEKYRKREGFTAIRLWEFATVHEELLQNPDKTKADELLKQAFEFSESSWFSVRGTAEEKADLQEIIDSLVELTLQ